MITIDKFIGTLIKIDPITAGIENSCIVRLVPYLCLQIPTNTDDSIAPSGINETIKPN